MANEKSITDNVVRLSWNIGLDDSLFIDTENHVSNSEVVQGVKSSVGTLMNVLVDDFNIDSETEEGINNRLDELHVTLRSGTELPMERERVILRMGKIGVIGSDSDSNLYSEEIDGRDNEIYISLDSLREESSNLRKILKDTEHGGDDLVGEEGQLEAFYEDKQRIKDTAIKLAFSRRLLKYGVLDDNLLNGELARNVGYHEWLEDTLVGREIDVDLLESLNHDTIKDEYASQKIAISSLRRTVWDKLFHEIVGVDDNKLVFFLMYRQVLAKNNENTVLFSEGSGLKKDLVAETLKKSYAPGSYGLHVV